MSSPLAKIIADAEALASDVSTFTADVQASALSKPGAAPRRKSGQGEAFWQFRPFRTEDSQQAIDWRRSARSDTLFVKENELQTARQFLFWLDSSQGFHWRSTDSVPTKAAAAATLFLAAAKVLSKTGETCGVAGQSKNLNPGHGLERLANDLWSSPDLAALSALRPNRATVLIASDFYADPKHWEQLLQRLAAQRHQGVLLFVADPAETGFPFEGRVRFSVPGRQKARLFGRAETVSDAYLERFNAHRSFLSDLAATIGWACLFHSTDQPLVPTFGDLITALSQHIGRGAT